MNVSFKDEPVSANTPITKARTERVVEEEIKVGSKLSLSAFPNPFSAKVTISFTLPHPQLVDLKVYDMQGKVIATLFTGEVQGNHPYEAVWQPGAREAAGMYIIRLDVNKQVNFKKVILVK